MNWSEILKKGGVPEPPGYIETVAKLKNKPKRKKGKGKKTSKLKTLHASTWGAIERLNPCDDLRLVLSENC